MADMARLVAGVAVAIVLLLAPSAPMVAQEACAAQPVTYLSDGLRIRGALMKPPGGGPFPTVIYNHGARTGRHKQPQLAVGTPCLEFVTQRRWVYLVPDRRGFGRSEGPSLSAVEQAARDLSDERLGSAVRARIRQEANDVLAGVDLLRTLPYADSKRIALIGYSWGGLIALRAASGAPATFRAVVIQAAGASDRDPYYDLQLREMIDMGRAIPAPMLVQNGSDDLESSVRFSRQVTDALTRLGKDVTLRIYPGTHDLFATYPRGPEGEWGRDALDFLARYLR